MELILLRTLKNACRAILTMDTILKEIDALNVINLVRNAEETLLKIALNVQKI